ncbi:hypothetical protein TCAL_06361 [Tigriopus californicus]|uniref:Anaphase-promoting complex subunit CDC26 n=1 Tax=Tigriopus californicus TaxID=6832 RepID=A0A553PH50_TIGCA|nr:anaphase-promoting complex subunit CDC26-like [Tigriopus californicus]TRY77013.1 hypothetical protein TCAL_06361 [Tigriopus californicus]|eukprot:TCALIF_06361-PA protein Name:"Similar to CDC26 Anaphase-promoting complex subunit CDC26 (Pongo abelii)" AED:0.06 eAED:0.11 QI:0/-1/0/1/-1/1/1/0/76
MIRRPPTRLELKMDDIKEYERMKSESRKNIFGNSPTHNSTANESGSLSSAAEPSSTDKRNALYARIGFDPKPRKPS